MSMQCITIQKHVLQGNFQDGESRWQYIRVQDTAIFTGKQAGRRRLATRFHRMSVLVTGGGLVGDFERKNCISCLLQVQHFDDKRDMPVYIHLQCDSEFGLRNVELIFQLSSAGSALPKIGRGNGML